MDHLRPLIKPRSLPLTQAVSGLTLTRVADELIVSRAEITSEGDVVWLDEGEGVFHGSTLVSIALDRGDMDLGPARGAPSILIDVLEKSVLLRLKLLRMARLEVERKCAPHRAGSMVTEMEFNIEEKRLLVDIYIECPLAAPCESEDEPDEGGV